MLRGGAAINHADSLFRTRCLEAMQFGSRRWMVAMAGIETPTRGFSIRPVAGHSSSVSRSVNFGGIRLAVNLTIIDDELYDVFAFSIRLK
jgi:hypothetical protein